MIIEVILIISAIVVIGLYLIRFAHFGKKLKLIFFGGILIFIVISSGIALSRRGIALDSFEGYMDAASIYLNWLAEFGKDSIKFTGNAIKSIVRVFELK
jgi:hypothetical protein